MTHNLTNYTRIKVILLLSLFTIILYLPIILKPEIVFNRGNDLVEFFWPVYYFARNQILTNHQLPLWNPLFFSGTPLLPDPQSPLLYLPNIIFLFFKNIDTGFFTLFFLHSLWGGVGAYILAKKGFRLSAFASFFTSLMYIASPKVAGYLEAGHVGLITSYAWLPFTILAIIFLSRKPTIKNTLFLAITLSALFYTHILIFGIATLFSIIFYYYLSFLNRKNILKQSLYLIITFIFVFSFTAVTLLPQIIWQKETTRNLLLLSPDVYPKWAGVKEFLKAFISPEIFGRNFMNSLDTEKWIPIGISILSLSIIGLTNIKLKIRMLILITLFFALLLCLNNISPIYNTLIKQNWYVLLRVSTRIWFIPNLILIFLAGYGIENLGKRKLSYILVGLVLCELVFLFWTRISKPIAISDNLAPKEVYELLSQDHDIFRVFCLNRCLSQKESAIYNLELADGYGTLQQTNYYNYSQQLAQAYWRNRYSLSIPPFEIYLYENLQPYSPNLSISNIKYVISPYPLKDKNLSLVKQISKYLIYENKIVYPRAYWLMAGGKIKKANISFYSPNKITIDISNNSGKLILSEVYSQGWKAFIDDKNEIPITESQNISCQVSISGNHSRIDFYYEPDEYIIGRTITLSMILITIVVSSYTICIKSKQR